jgi:EAL and modified HD-GYP domain-containing signal transduction protein
MEHPFPLVTLQPVSDSRNAWVALSLGVTPPDDFTVARIFGEFGLAAALGPLPCIVSPVDARVLADALPPDRAVFRLPVARCCDPAQDDALHQMKAQGFRLMADGLPEAGRHLSDAVHAFALRCPAHGLHAGMAAWLKRLPGPHLAIGPVPSECPQACPLHWFTGPACSAVQSHVPAKSIDAPSRLLLLELLAKVANDADSHEIETIIKRDPQLSYHLLKLVNSVGFALTTKITSFNQAITLLGRRQLQRWLQLLLYAHTRDGDKANPLLPRAAMRAGLTEALCQASGGTHEMYDRAFMAGMFSLLDQLFGMPIDEIVGPLNLADDVYAALTRHSGRLGTLLQAVAAAEGADAEELAARLAEAGIDNETWARSLVSACHWAVQVSCEA